MNTIDTTQQLAALYEADFALWLDQTVQLLKQGRVTEIDLENLIEEMESLGKRDKREIQSRLIVLLLHLLKYAYQPEHRSRSWLATINEQRRQILLILEDSPSLKIHLTEKFIDCYTKARKEAADATGLDLVTFPEQSPFGEINVLTEGWLP
jgi:hypothetical protein